LTFAEGTLITNPPAPAPATSEDNDTGATLNHPTKAIDHRNNNTPNSIVALERSAD